MGMQKLQLQQKISALEKNKQTVLSEKQKSAEDKTALELLVRHDDVTMTNTYAMMTS